MVSINNRLNKIFLRVDVVSNFCRIFAGSSGVGKSYYLDLLVKELAKDGKRADHIMYKTRKMVERILSFNEHIDLIILDELELYHEDIDIDAVRTHCDNLWILSRRFVKYEYYELPSITMTITDSEVLFYEKHGSI